MLDTMFEQLGVQTQTGHALMQEIANRDAEIEAWRKAQAQINAELLEARETIATFRDAQDALNMQLDDALIDLYEMRRLFRCANEVKRDWRNHAKYNVAELAKCRAELEGRERAATVIQSIDARD